MTKRTPNTKDEFFDYRLTQTDKKIDEAKIELQRGIETINKKLDDTYATKQYVDSKLEPIEIDITYLKKVVYGAVGLILSIVLAAIVYAVVKR